MVDSMQSVASGSCPSLGVVKRVGLAAGGADKLQGADHLSRSGHFALSDSRLAEFLPPRNTNCPSRPLFLYFFFRFSHFPFDDRLSPLTAITAFTMAQPGQPSPQQMAQMAAMQQQFAAEAAKRGLTPEQFAQKQREQLTADAAKLGLTPEQYVAQLRMRAMQAHQQQMEAQRQAQGSPQPGQPQQPQPEQQQGQSGQPQAQQQPQPQQQTHQVPVQPGQPADPKALAVANFLRSQNLKPRTCILDGQRKDMFKGE